LNSPKLADSPILIGRIVGHHGLKGWVKIESFTRPREQIREYQVIMVAMHGNWKPVRIEECKTQGRNLLARLEGYESREEATPVIGADIAIDYDQLTELSEGEFYWIDLIGVPVVNLQGLEFGRINSIIETGANDVIVVQYGHAEILIPWIPDVVRDVRLEEGLIVVDWQKDDLS